MPEKADDGPVTTGMPHSQRPLDAYPAPLPSNVSAGTSTAFAVVVEPAAIVTTRPAAPSPGTRPYTVSYEAPAGMPPIVKAPCALAVTAGIGTPSSSTRAPATGSPS